MDRPDIQGAGLCLWVFRVSPTGGWQLVPPVPSAANPAQRWFFTIPAAANDRRLGRCGWSGLLRRGDEPRECQQLVKAYWRPPARWTLSIQYTFFCLWSVRWFIGPVMIQDFSRDRKAKRNAKSHHLRMMAPRSRSPACQRNGGCGFSFDCSCALNVAQICHQ